MKYIIFFFLLSSNALLNGQTISGTVYEMNSNIPIAFAVIGIIGQNEGTVADYNGKYTLQIGTKHLNDSLRFSCLGYHPYSVKIADFITLNNGTVHLVKKIYEIPEAVVRPKKFREKTLGITIHNKAFWNQVALMAKGAEFGIWMNNKGSVFIKEATLHLAYFPNHSFSFQLNIYQKNDNEHIESILRNPVEVILNNSLEIKDKITVDLRHLNLFVTGDFMVTFVYLESSGSGREYFRFCVSPNPMKKSYNRHIWYDDWAVEPPGASISVKVDVERK